MILSKKLKTEVFQVKADYKVLRKHAPFIAILQLGLEYEDLDAGLLKRELLSALSIPACENILKRLVEMGHLEPDEYNEYEEYNEYDAYNGVYYLSELGKVGAKRKEFYENRTGVLEIEVLKEDSVFVPEKIIRIEEKRADRIEEGKVINLPDKFYNLCNSKQSIPLKNNTFILDKMEQKYYPLKNKKQKNSESKLQIKIENNTMSISIGQYQKELEEHSEKEAKQVILKNHFKTAYSEKYNSIKVPFDPNKLDLQRKCQIERPIFRDTRFDPISIPNVQCIPESKTDAYDWHRALVKTSVEAYCFSDAAFQELANKVAERFIAHSAILKDSLNRQTMIASLNQRKDFYQRAKLETIDYLNY